MDIKIDHDYVVLEHDRAGYLKKNRNITEFMVRQAIAGKYPNGFKEKSERTTQRIAGKVTGAFNTAVLKEQDSITVSLDQAQFLLEVMRDWGVPGTFTPWFLTFFEYLEDAVKKEEEAEKVTKASK